MPSWLRLVAIATVSLLVCGWLFSSDAVVDTTGAVDPVTTNRPDDADVHDTTIADCTDTDHCGEQNGDVALVQGEGGAPERYLKFYGFPYGQFANQLVAVAKAYGLAVQLNRTLVEPELIASAQDYFSGERPVPLFQLFDRSTLARGPVRWVTLKEYNSLGIVPATEVCYYGTRCWCCNETIQKKVLPTSRGKWTLCDCSLEAFPADTTAPTYVLHFQSTFHSDRGNDAGCGAGTSIFAWLQPVAPVQAAVDSFRNGHTSLLGPYLGVHLRQMKQDVDPVTYCTRKMGLLGWWYTDVKGLQWRPSGDECFMPAEVVECVLRERSGNGSAVGLFLASDGKNGSHLAALNALGGVRFSGSWGGKPWGRAKRVVSDMVLLRDATWFLGNPLSSFSSVVCAMRRARGQECGNMAPPVTSGQCLTIPDNQDSMLTSVKRVKPPQVLQGYLEPSCPHGGGT